MSYVVAMIVFIVFAALLVGLIFGPTYIFREKAKPKSSAGGGFTAGKASSCDLSCDLGRGLGCGDGLCTNHMSSRGLYREGTTATSILSVRDDNN